MQNCLNNQSLVLKEQLTGVNIIQKKLIERSNQHLDCLIDPIFQGVNGLFVFSFENEAQRRSYNRHYIPIEEIRDYNVMIDGQKFFNQPIRTDLITYDNIQKIATG